MKEIKVECPCCDTTLIVDVRSQKVMRHSAPAELDEFGKPRRGSTAAWDAAEKRIQGAKSRGTDAFDSALGREKARDRDLDDLFDRAKGNVQRRKDDLDS